MVAKSTANPANNPTEAPRPMRSGWKEPEGSAKGIASGAPFWTESGLGGPFP